MWLGNWVSEAREMQMTPGNDSLSNGKKHNKSASVLSDHKHPALVPQEILRYLNLFLFFTSGEITQVTFFLIFIYLLFYYYYFKWDIPNHFLLLQVGTFCFSCVRNSPRYKAKFPLLPYQ